MTVKPSGRALRAAASAALREAMAAIWTRYTVLFDRVEAPDPDGTGGLAPAVEDGVLSVALGRRAPLSAPARPLLAVSARVLSRRVESARVLSREPDASAVESPPMSHR